MEPEIPMDVCYAPKMRVENGVWLGGGGDLDTDIACELVPAGHADWCLCQASAHTHTSQVHSKHTSYHIHPT